MATRSSYVQKRKIEEEQESRKTYKSNDGTAKFPKKPQLFQCYKLANGYDCRIGAWMGEVQIRISGEYDLTEKRPPASYPFDKFASTSTGIIDLNQLSKTVFLKESEVVCLPDVLTDIYEDDFKTSASYTLSSLSEEDRAKKELDTFAPDTSAEIRVSPKDGFCYITTYMLASGQNQMDQFRVETACCAVPFDSIVKFKLQVPTIVDHFRKAYSSILMLKELVLMESGKTLSLMLARKHGKFSGKDVMERSPRLVDNFLNIYTEFMGMGYPANLTRLVHEKIKLSYTLNYPPLDVMNTIFVVLGQIDVLFQPEYIKME